MAMETTQRKILIIYTIIISFFFFPFLFYWPCTLEIFTKKKNSMYHTSNDFTLLKLLGPLSISLPVI